jgi:excisionase family DNA binding protein
MTAIDRSSEDFLSPPQASEPISPSIEFITVPEFARRVGVARETAYRLVKRQEVPGTVKLGQNIRIRWDLWLRASSQ